MRNTAKAYSGIVSLALIVTVLIVLVPIPPAKAQFVLAYDYPTPNGNGIAYINGYVDGVYNGSMYANPDSYPTATTNNPMYVDAGVSLSLKVGCWLNGTFMSVSSLAQGKQVLRHNVTVTALNGTILFSQQNFTYDSGTDYYAPMYFYDYTVTLNFDVIAGGYYTVTVIYELYY